MPVNAQIQGLLDLIASRNVPPHYLLPPAEARVNMEKSRAVFKWQEIKLPRVEPLSIPGPAGGIPARVYAPSTQRGLPTLVYFHGGGWVIGSLDTHDDLCRYLARESGCLVVSVDYRLAPEHKFPAAVDDAWAATRWIAANAKALGGNGDRLAVAGDSAGGNLATVMCLLARDGGGPPLRYQLLIYPAVAHDFSGPSMQAYGEGFLLTTKGMHWFWDHYLSRPEDARDVRASPMLAPSLAGLPPALVAVVEYDVLRDEGEAYAQRLKKEGVATRLVRYDGMIHGCAGMLVVDGARKMLGDFALALKQALA